MKELRQLAAAVVRHIRETLQAPHPHDVHRDMLEALGDVERALEHKDTDEALRDLLAVAEAIDMSIPDDELGAELEPIEDDDDAGGAELDDDDGDEDTKR
jgi:hypothetical protein